MYSTLASIDTGKEIYNLELDCTNETKQLNVKFITNAIDKEGTHSQFICYQ